jgi:hypothetical protein
MTIRMTSPKWLVSIILASALAACGGGSGSGDDGGADDDASDGGQGCRGEFCPDAAFVPSSCKRVDLIFAVDNSGSMQEEKAALVSQVFPGFASRLLTIGAGLEDYQAGVVDACPDPSNLHTVGLDGACNFASGHSWMSSADPDLQAEFGCVGDIDSSDMNCTGNNDDEQPASSAAAALENANAHGSNDGFNRDDALLVVVAITDEDEQPTPDQTAQEVYDRLVATKGGDVRRMVFLGIGGGSSCSGAYGHADQATKTKAIADLFIAQNRGVFWDLCQGNLEDGLDQAMQVIEHACNDLPID